MKPVRVLFVCLGNICRSPTAEGAFRALIKHRADVARFIVDSAGTSGHHDGDGPDPRSAAAAARHGMDITGQRSRRVRAEDFVDFDYVLAMDAENLASLQRIAPADADCVVARFLDYADTSRKDVPDPYYGGPSGFDDVFALCSLAAEGFLAHIDA